MSLSTIPIIIDAITALGNRVTVADVSTRTGLPLQSSIISLNHIAAKTKAVLEVSGTGNILYAFPADLKNAYYGNGVGQLLRKVLSIVGSVLAYLVRVSFGILLIASVVTLVILFAITIMVGMFAADGSDGDFGDLDFDVDFNFCDVSNLIMFFAWWNHDVDGGTVTYFGKQVEVRERGFLSNCFAFLFGDGNPNKGFEEKTWQYIADLIRINNGAIIAEQLAPYSGAVGSEMNAVFPTLARFEGVPEVTETGNIVYLFPSMLVTSAQRHFLEVPDYAEEQQWKFTNGPISKLDLVFYFAWANLAGWYGLSLVIDHQHFFEQYATIVHAALGYSVFFLTVPILRCFVNAFRNALIDYRNGIRRQAAEALASLPNTEKIRESQAYGQNLVYLCEQEAVYSTDRDLIEQQFEN